MIVDYGYGDAAPTTALGGKLARRGSTVMGIGSQESDTRKVNYGYGDAVPMAALSKLARRASNGMEFGAHKNPNPENIHEQSNPMGGNQSMRSTTLKNSLARRMSSGPGLTKGRRGSSFGGFSRRGSAAGTTFGRRLSTTGVVHQRSDLMSASNQPSTPSLESEGKTSKKKKRSRWSFFVKKNVDDEDSTSDNYALLDASDSDSSEGILAYVGKTQVQLMGFKNTNQDSDNESSGRSQFDIDNDQDSEKNLLAMKGAENSSSVEDEPLQFDPEDACVGTTVLRASTALQGVRDKHPTRTILGTAAALEVSRPDACVSGGELDTGMPEPISPTRTEEMSNDSTNPCDEQQLSTTEGDDESGGRKHRSKSDRPSNNDRKSSTPSPKKRRSKQTDTATGDSGSNHDMPSQNTSRRSSANSNRSERVSRPDSPTKRRSRRLEEHDENQRSRSSPVKRRSRREEEHDDNQSSRSSRLESPAKRRSRKPDEHEENQQSRSSRFESPTKRRSRKSEDHDEDKQSRTSRPESPAKRRSRRIEEHDEDQQSRSSRRESPTKRRSRRQGEHDEDQKSRSSRPESPTKRRHRRREGNDEEKLGRSSRHGSPSKQSSKSRRCERVPPPMDNETEVRDKHSSSKSRSGKRESRASSSKSKGKRDSPSQLASSSETPLKLRSDKVDHNKRTKSIADRLRAPAL